MFYIIFEVFALIALLFYILFHYVYLRGTDVHNNNRSSTGLGLSILIAFCFLTPFDFLSEYWSFARFIYSLVFGWIIIGGIGFVRVVFFEEVNTKNNNNDNSSDKKNNSK